MAGDPHPLFVAGDAVDKSAARSYLPLRVGTTDYVRATNFNGGWLVYIGSKDAYYERDASDTTTADDDDNTIVGPNGERWKKIAGGGVLINASGNTAGRDAYDDEDPPYAYYDTEAELLFLMQPDGEWGDGFSLKGAEGDQGDQGIQGIPGSDPGILFNWNTATNDADHDPGDLWANNADLSAATVLFADDVNRAGSSVATFIAALDDADNPEKGDLILHRLTDGAIASFKVGVVTDDTGYAEIAISGHSGVTSFANNDIISFQFFRSGDKGTDGLGAGDVVGPSSSVASEIALFDGTTGKLLKRATTTGLLKATSGVLSSAVGDTDYLTADADLLAIAALTSAADKLPYATGAQAWALTTLTSYIRTLLDDTTAATALATLTARGQGRETIFIPAAAMTPRTTNGAAVGTAEMSSNKNMFKTLDFDTTTQEFAQFEIWFPKSWNLSTVTFQPIWSHPSTTTNFGVAFGLAGVARSNDDAGDVAFGTAQTSVDTGGTTNDIYMGPESSAITIAGTPAAEDSVQFQLNRTVADAGDTMAVDARLHGVRLFFTTNAVTDA